MELAFHALEVFSGKRAGVKCADVLAQSFKRTQLLVSWHWHRPTGHEILTLGQPSAIVVVSPPNIVAEVHCPVFPESRHALC